eukprot:CAMPEP_0170509690 /NCGR_PEP_ID=MMETSP0208-20121228/65351_1 /TAXON_ID=197538 /ORGANISM="Strombidium inclinatum, Strain S3" /LENGTH=60 /DNA_ID=CAMNT_0010793073 /DNA_START=874 /DNA_END=1056 /DNA_ORIENTATION=-
MKIVDQEFHSPKVVRKSTDTKVAGRKKPDSTGGMISIEGNEISKKKLKGYGVQSSLQSTI